MSGLTRAGVDLVAIALLVFGLYVPRHRRRDLVVAFLGVNVGVLAVAGAMSGSEVGAGLGLGLFGVLSIIRLRSTELDQHEVAYYFSSLALGLLAALSGDVVQAVGWMVLVLVVMYLGDHPRLFPRYRRQLVVLDSAITDPTALVARLEQVLGARVCSTTVIKLDLVNDTTVVEVRYQLRRRRYGAGRDGTARGLPAL
jgi:hypothetical protein